MKRRKVNWTDNNLRRSCRLIHIIEGKVDGRKEEEEGVSSYWMISRKRKTTGTRKGKH
jgi:hypothetical protein